MKWISVSERLPEQLESVLAFVPAENEPWGEQIINTGYLHNRGWEIGEHPYRIEQVTHWAKLEPPRQKKP